MSPTSTLLHALKDQIRSVKYSIRAEAHRPGSLVPRAFQSPEIRRLTSLGAVVSTPAFRLADGLVTRVETIAMDLLGTARRGDALVVEPIGVYLEEAPDFTDKLFPVLKQVVELRGGPDAFVSEQALDAAWSLASDRLRRVAGDPDPVLACAVVAEALSQSRAVRQLGYRAGAVETNFSGAPSAYGGIVAGLMIAVVTVKPAAARDGAALLESADSAVNARFDRFRRALDSEAAAECVAAEYRKLLPFLP